jgi:hypothetical protein
VKADTLDELVQTHLRKGAKIVFPRSGGRPAGAWRASWKIRT